MELLISHVAVAVLAALWTWLIKREPRAPDVQVMARVNDELVKVLREREASHARFLLSALSATSANARRGRGGASSPLPAPISMVPMEGGGNGFHQQEPDNDRIPADQI